MLTPLLSWWDSPPFGMLEKTSLCCERPQELPPSFSPSLPLPWVNSKCGHQHMLLGTAPRGAASGPPSLCLHMETGLAAAKPQVLGSSNQPVTHPPGRRAQRQRRASAAFQGQIQPWAGHSHQEGTRGGGAAGWSLGMHRTSNPRSHHWEGDGWMQHLSQMREG